MILRGFLAALAAITLLALPGLAQDAVPPAVPTGDYGARAATGGAQTLDDILARQKQQQIDDAFRRDNIGDPANATGLTNPLGTLGGASSSDLWRALRYGEADLTVTTSAPGARMAIQSGGMRWLALRRGPLREYGGYLLLATIAVLAVFFLLRGRIRIEGAHGTATITRFNALERFGHWLVAGSFVVLALTGLFLLFGRTWLIDLLGKGTYAGLAGAGKMAHDNIAWAFMIGLVLIFVLWVVQNFPGRADLKWLLLGGGLFTKGVHPPARKFNAGQKILFWLVIIFGVSVSLSGLALLFPFDLPVSFSRVFAALDATGVPQWAGFNPLPTAHGPIEEMELAHLFHAGVAFLFMALIIAHIYIGTLGMEGAIDAMASGEVDVQWAKEHHALWYDEVAGRTSGDHATPEPAE